MYSARTTVLSFALIALTALGVSASNFVFEDEEPEVTDRVARISVIRGDVSIRRSGVDEWEKAVLNLPVVEGDEITTADGARFEIQFDANTHVRIASNSFLQITTLSDSGIALSLAEGSLSLNALKFDQNKKFFEIDAPKTTVAVQRSGRYRVDAGGSGSHEIRVSVLDDGEARVYSNNAGFTVRDGRSAKIFVEGTFAGDVENGLATRDSDDFDQWIAERIDVVAKRLSTASYGQFYDDDIYGAEDLSDNGDWTYTRDYGYIWRPYSRSISNYSNWSPYRYGHWRWLPVYGWTWVNDEPWGWATYHHGRWIWYSGSWYWSPYSYYRNGRSWWRPALVIVRIFNNNVCWYPLPYRHRYNNYNRHYNARNRRPGTSTGSGNTTQVPISKTVIEEIPDTGVITIPLDDFGKRRSVNTTLPSQTARRVITKDPNEADELKRLPSMGDIKTKVDKGIRAETPPWASANVAARTGAAKRDRTEPLDPALRNKIIYGDRPVVTPGINAEPQTQSAEPRKIPQTGAVGRPVTKKSDTVKPEPQRETPPWVEPQRETRRRTDVPVVKAEPKPEPQRREAPPYVETKRRESPPVRTEQPRSDPPKTRETPSQPKSEPKSEPTRKSDPPPQKSEPSPRSDSSPARKPKDS